VEEGRGDKEEAAAAADDAALDQAEEELQRQIEAELSAKPLESASPAPAHELADRGRHGEATNSAPRMQAPSPAEASKPPQITAGNGKFRLPPPTPESPGPAPGGRKGGQEALPPAVERVGLGMVLAEDDDGVCTHLLSSLSLSQPPSPLPPISLFLSWSPLSLTPTRLAISAPRHGLSSSSSSLNPKP